MSEFGLELLEQLSVPVNYENFDVQDSEVAVCLSVEGQDVWKPSKLHDRKWNVTNQEMTQVSIRSREFVPIYLNKCTMNKSLLLNFFNVSTSKVVNILRICKNVAFKRL